LRIARSGQVWGPGRAQGRSGFGYLDGAFPGVAFDKLQHMVNLFADTTLKTMPKCLWVQTPEGKDLLRFEHQVLPDSVPLPSRSTVTTQGCKISAVAEPAQYTELFNPFQAAEVQVVAAKAGTAGTLKPFVPPSCTKFLDLMKRQDATRQRRSASPSPLPNSPRAMVEDQ
jgi:hypothetical protein